MVGCSSSKMMHTKTHAAFSRWVAIICIMLSGVLGGTTTGVAQVATKEKNPYHQHYHDSLKAMDYPYTFPLFAKKVYKRGFDLPFTYGISTMYYTQVQDINIDKTLIGFNSSELVDLSEFIRFGTVVAKTNAFTVRPDFWVFPFLNIYGIFGVGNTSTTVPLVRPVNFETRQEFGAKSMGIGATVAGGVGPVFIIVDNNINFANVESLVEPVPAYNLDARIGHNFVAPTRADKGLAVWVGAFYQKISSDTKGSILISDLFPEGTGDLEENFIGRLDEWAEGLPLGQQVVAKQIIRKIDDYLSGLDVSDTQINYVLDKSMAAPLNMVLGAQYQHNKHWQFRTEVGVFGRRSSFMVMANYRFEHIGKKKN